MNKAITLSILCLATLLSGCGPANRVIDGDSLLVYTVIDNGSGRFGRYKCYIYNPNNKGEDGGSFALYTNTRFNVGDRVVIIRVLETEPPKTEKAKGAP